MIRLVPLILGLVGFLLADGSLSAQGKTAGTIVGFLTAKGNNWAEIKADGEDKARRYLAIGDKSGPDKIVLKAIADAPLNARVQMDWKQGSAARIVKLQVLRKPDTDPK